MTDATQATADPPPTPTRRRPRRRALRLLAGGLGSVLLLAVVLVVLVLGTQPGLRAALALAQDFATGVISVGKVEGRVLGRLHLEDLEVHLTDLDLRLGSLDLDWSPLGAFTGTLRIAQLVARDVDIVIVPGQEQKPQPIVLPQIGLPLRIEIDEVLVERLRVLHRGVGVPLFVLDRARLAGGFKGSELDLMRLELELPEPRLAARAAGRVQLLADYPLDLHLDWDLSLAPAVSLKGRGRIGGDLQRLTIEHDVSGSAQVKLDALVKDVLVRPSWEGLVQIKGVRVPDFQVGGPEVQVKGRLETRGDLDAATLTGTLDGTAPNRSDFGHLQVALDGAWEARVLTLRTLELHESVSGAEFKAEGGLDLNPKPGTFRLKGAWERLRWPLTGDLAAEAPRGRLDASGTFDAYDYALSALVQGPDIPATDLDLKGRGDAKGTHLAALVLKTLGGSLDASGDLTWAPALAWDLKVRGKELNPAALAPGLEDRIGLSLDSKGGLDGFGYDLMVTSQGPGLPPARLALGGKGDARGTQIETLRLEALKGRLEGRARAAWDPRVTWEADLTASGIDPGAYAPEWPGRIDGRITAQGRLEPTGPNLTVALESVQGTLRAYPIAAAGKVSMAAGTVRVEGFSAASGPSTVRVDGSMAQTLDLRFDLGSPDLASLLPGAKGSIQAKGQVTGAVKTPAIRLDLSAKDTAFAGQGIAGLTGNLDLSLTPEGPFKVQLDGAGLVAGPLRGESFTVRGDGSMRNHRLSLALTGQPLAARLEASGGLKDQGAYQGSLTRLDLDSQPYGNWRLQKPMPLSLAGPKIAAGPFCLRNGQGSGGCLGFDQATAGQWAADIDLDKLGFELIQGFLPENQAAEGAARIKGRFQAAGPVLTGNLVAEVPRGTIRLALGSGRTEELDFSATRLTLDAGGKGLGARLDLPLKGLGQVGGSVDLPGWRLDDPARAGQPLRGVVKANVTGLARIASLVPDLTEVTGSLSADLTLGGTLGKPGVQGQAALSGFGAEVPLIGLKVANLNLRLVASAMDRLELDGQGTIGGGRLGLSGDARLGPDGVVGRFLASGTRLKVADTKEYFALVSPQIEVDLNPQGARVSGEIKVPEARIRPRAIPAGTVSPSPDVVLVDQAREQKPPFPVAIDLRLNLGDNVTIDAFGVRGRLAGDLRVTQAPGKEMLGDGQLSIVDGIYRFSAGFGLGAELGAPLTITQGRLVYARSPIGNPGLLLQASREGGTASAGVQVRGNIRNPKLAFFSDSDPGMSQAEITKYLLTGIPPRNDSDPAGQAVAVGTYVAPKLYVEYESAIGDRKDAVKLRYEWTRNIELQTETGQNPGGDIFYKFEK